MVGGGGGTGTQVRHGGLAGGGSVGGVGAGGVGAGGITTVVGGGCTANKTQKLAQIFPKPF